MTQGSSSTNKNKDSKELTGQQQQQQQQAQQQNEGMKAAQQAGANKQHNTLEKKITQLHETITRLQEEQHQVAQTNSILMSIIIQMFSQQMGMTIPKEQLLAAGLSSDISRNAMKSKKETDSKNGSAPPAHETLGLLLKLVSDTKTTTTRHQLPNSPSGSSSKPSPKNV
ncbi:hypothetical protein BGX27_004579 [Mortierella sp. AM989]|nr:hypothetical protein BGX27_004579 [Mortierella sp. AM989]